MGSVLKNFHWLLISYTLYGAYLLYEEKANTLDNIENQIKPTVSEFSSNAKNLEEIKRYLNNINEEKQKIEKVALEIERNQQLLPSEFDDAGNIQALKKWADDLNIRDIGISPDLEKEKEFLVTRSYKVKVKATFIQLLILLEKIGGYKRIMNVGQISYNIDSESQKGRFQIIDAELFVEVYRYNSKHKEDRGYDKVEQKFKVNESTKSNESES